VGGVGGAEGAGRGDEWVGEGAVEGGADWLGKRSARPQQEKNSSKEYFQPRKLPADYFLPRENGGCR